MIRALKRAIARHRLARDVAKRRESFEMQQFRKRRNAALKASRGVAA